MSETGILSKTAGRMINALRNGLDLADTFLQVNQCLIAAQEGIRRQITENHPEGSLLRNLYFPSRWSLNNNVFTSRFAAPPLTAPSFSKHASGTVQILRVHLLSSNWGSQRKGISMLKEKKTKKKSVLRSRISRIAWSTQWTARQLEIGRETLTGKTTTNKQTKKKKRKEKRRKEELERTGVGRGGMEIM